MRRECLRTAVCQPVVYAALFCVAIACFSTDLVANDWAQWRGPYGTGSLNLVDTDKGPPVSWSSTENVAWKVAVPGRGHSTPIVVGNRIFLTTAIPIGDRLPPRMSGRPGEHDNLPITSKMRFEVICFDRVDGKILWTKTAKEAIPVEAGHITASLASASSVADDKYVYAMFGSHGLYCYSYDGELVWKEEFGQMHTKHGHGEGASPILHGDTLVMNWDHEERSFIVALNRNSGEQVWRHERSEDTSWSSPVIIEVDGRSQVVACGTNRIRGYDLLTGEVIWECGGLSSNIVATPVYDSSSGILVAGSSYEIRSIMAIKLPGARGDITESKRVVWSRTRGTPYVPSLLLTKGHVYYLAHYQNVLTRVRVSDGSDSPGSMRLGELSNIYASPISDGRNVYVTDLDGTTLVLTNDEVPRPISVNRLNEPVSASLAISGSELFIRSEKHLYCIRQ
jgi:outer membrane protein assembly factor BamB